MFTYMQLSTLSECMEGLYFPDSHPAWGKGHMTNVSGLKEVTCITFMLEHLFDDVGCSSTLFLLYDQGRDFLLNWKAVWTTENRQ